MGISFCELGSHVGFDERDLFLRDMKLVHNFVIARDIQRG